MRIALIGAGMAGLSCAQALTAAGHTCRLLDKGRGPGGRMSTRRMDTPAGEASFDHGAPLFIAQDPQFVRQVAAWAADGDVAPWPAAGAEAWVGRPAMNAPLRRMAAGLDVQWSVRVDALVRDGAGWRLVGTDLAAGQAWGDGPFDAMVVAVPAEQAASLLTPVDPVRAALAAETRSAPCWTVMAAFADRLAAPDQLAADGPIAWAARNSAKPGRTGPESWVIQAGPDWSIAHLEDAAETVLSALLEAFAARLDAPLPPPLAAAAHRWRYARPAPGDVVAPWEGDLSLGVCGDWTGAPTVEGAWLSGRQAANALVAACA